MDTDSTIVTYSEAAELILPRQRSLRHPASFSQPAAVGFAALGQQGPDAAEPQLAAVRLRVVGAVSLHAVRPAARSARLASNRPDAVHQGKQLSHIVAVGRRDLTSQYVTEAAVFRDRLELWLTGTRSRVLRRPTA